MNNEPVAWMDKESNTTMIGGIYPKKLEQYVIGLDTRIVALESHPAKTLTDEEIQDLWAEMDWSGQPELEFARAILRKAQEK
jgi:hypothetical protein